MINLKSLTITFFGLLSFYGFSQTSATAGKTGTNNQNYEIKSGPDGNATASTITVKGSPDLDQAGDITLQTGTGTWGPEAKINFLSSTSYFDGNVGIGTVNPKEKLHVYGGTASIEGDIGTLPANTSYWPTGKHTLELQNNDKGDVVMSFHRAGASNAAIVHSTTGGLSFSGNGNSDNKKHMHLTSSGNVGIGTTDPTQKLVVKGTTVVGDGDWGALIVDGKEKNDWLFNAHNNGQFLLIRTQDDTAASWSKNVMVMNRLNGNVGIGRTPGGAKLDVAGNIRATNQTISKSYLMDDGNTDMLIYRDNDVGDWSLLRTNKGNGIGLIGEPDKVALSVSRINSNVGIGTTDTKGFKLGVNGSIAALEVKVALYDNWPDYVFTNEYKLPTLKEVENHITEKGHLQNIPSAKEVKENEGFFLGDMNTKLLQKIEELTLYTIQQEKKIEALEVKNTEVNELREKSELQDQKIELLLKRLEKLEAAPSQSSPKGKR